MQIRHHPQLINTDQYFLVNLMWFQDLLLITGLSLAQVTCSPHLRRKCKYSKMTQIFNVTTSTMLVETSGARRNLFRLEKFGSLNRDKAKHYFRILLIPESPGWEKLSMAWFINYGLIMGKLYIKEYLPKISLGSWFVGLAHFEYYLYLPK